MAHRTCTSLLAGLSLSLALPALVVGCGGSQSSDTAEPDQDPGQETPETVDQALTDYEPIAIEGQRYSPEALGRPGMLQVTPKRKIPLRRARRKAKRRRHSEVDVQILATLLWKRANKLVKSEPEKAEELRTEALEALRKEHERTSGETGVITLQMLASAEMWAEERDAAVEIYRTLLERFSEHKGVPTWKTWLAYIHLGAGRTAEAAKVTEGWELEKQGHLGAYVMSWIAFRQEGAGAAREAIVHTAESWKGNLPVPLQGDLLMFHARAGAELDEITPVIEKLAKKNLNLQYAWLFRLSEEYKKAGYYGRASRALDHLLDEVMAGQDVPVEDYVGFRFRQADYQFRLDAPEKAAEYITDAHGKLEECSEEKCPEEVRQNVKDRVSKLAVFYHTTYHSTLDESYFDPAKKLYEYLISLELPDKEEMKKNLTNLEDTRARANPDSGKHDAKIMGDLVRTRTEVLRACYEGGLQRDPELEGGLTLTIEVSSEGEVKGGKTEPGAGEEGLAAVAGCALERAKTWSFPGRTTDGTTVMAVPFTLASP